jgi:succinate dehydrogenase hydrophobic anchor subunit
VPPDPRNVKLERDDLEQLIRLKRFYGRWILVTMAAQLIVVNTVFLLYAALGYDWAPPAGVVQVWLAATFVQVVSVVVVIARSLFPGEK